MNKEQIVARREMAEMCDGEFVTVTTIGGASFSGTLAFNDVEVIVYEKFKGGGVSRHFVFLDAIASISCH